MEDPSRGSNLIREFARERSIRRVLRVLKAKRTRVDEDLNQLVAHLGLLVPLSQKQGDKSILLEALGRLENDAFTQLLMEVIEKEL